MTKKLVLKLGVHDEKAKQKALKAVASLSGIDSLAMDMKEQKLTVIGAVDPVQVVRKLRKSWCADLLTVGPAKEAEKKKEGESKKGDAKKEDGKKKEIEPIEAFWKPIYENHYPYYVQCYHVCSCEESPYGCVIG